MWGSNVSPSKLPGPRTTQPCDASDAQFKPDLYGVGPVAGEVAALVGVAVAVAVGVGDEVAEGDGVGDEVAEGDGVGLGDGRGGGSSSLKSRLLLSQPGSLLSIFPSPSSSSPLVHAVVPPPRGGVDDEPPVLEPEAAGDVAATAALVGVGLGAGLGDSVESFRELQPGSAGKSLLPSRSSSFPLEHCLAVAGTMVSGISSGTTSAIGSSGGGGGPPKGKASWTEAVFSISSSTTCGAGSGLSDRATEKYANNAKGRMPSTTRPPVWVRALNVAQGLGWGSETAGS